MVIVDNAAVGMRCQCLLTSAFSFLLHSVSEIEPAGFVILLCITFYIFATLFSTAAVPIFYFILFYFLWSENVDLESG